MILYGVKSYYSNVSSNIYDSPYYYENDMMTFNTEVEFEKSLDVKNC